MSDLQPDLEDQRTGNLNSRAGRRDGPARVSFAGDITLPPVLESTFRFDGPWIGNLEGPVTRSTHPVRGKIALRSTTVGVLAAFGRLPLALGMANNHVMDFGLTGYDATTEELRRAGVRWFGVGTESDNFANPLVFDCDDSRVAVVGYVSASTHPIAVNGVGPAPLDVERITRDLATARQHGATRVVAYLHWGTEECDLPDPCDTQLARALVSGGVALIVGHHSHCIQQSEVIDGTPVFYGVGNFVMPDLEVRIEPAESGSERWVYRKRQMAWNQRSLVIDWAPASGAVGLRGTRYRRGVVRPDDSMSPPPPLTETGAPYLQKFRRAAWKAQWRGRLAVAAAAPVRALLRAGVRAGRGFR